MTGAELIVKCLENENVKSIYGIPGKENLEILDALIESSIEFVTVRHEQAAAYMANVEGRLTQRAGTCLSTLRPRATNLAAGLTNAQIDAAPVVVLAGEPSLLNTDEYSSQKVNIKTLFEMLSKSSIRIQNKKNISRIIHKAYETAEKPKMGVSFIGIPENISATYIENEILINSQEKSYFLMPDAKTIEKACQAISKSRFPIILAGSEVIRKKASHELLDLSQKLQVPVATTLAAKGVIPNSHDLSLGAIGLQQKDHQACGFDRADLIICVGFDSFEYSAKFWNSNKTPIVHIHSILPEIDQHYTVEHQLIGSIPHLLNEVKEHCKTKTNNLKNDFFTLKTITRNELEQYENDLSFPMKPQKIICDIRKTLNQDDILISDIGLHKLWLERLFPVENANTTVFTNDNAAMGMGVPGAISAKRLFPHKNVLLVTSDAGFMMNSQEIETAIRYDVPIVILIWHDKSFGMMRMFQKQNFGREAFVKFKNPDFLSFAKSFGVDGIRVDHAKDLTKALKKAFQKQKICIIDCAVDYNANTNFTKSLGNLLKLA